MNTASGLYPSQHGRGKRPPGTFLRCSTAVRRRNLILKDGPLRPPRRRKVQLQRECSQARRVYHKPVGMSIAPASALWGAPVVPGFRSTQRGRRWKVCAGVNRRGRRETRQVEGDQKGGGGRAFRPYRWAWLAATAGSGRRRGELLPQDVHHLAADPAARFVKALLKVLRPDKLDESGAGCGIVFTADRPIVIPGP
jgi:hypothetical protein